LPLPLSFALPLMAFRPSRPLLINPLFLAGAFVVKKALVLGAGHAYGVPRIYRRILEVERRMYPTRIQADRESFQTIVKSAIRLPNEAGKLFNAHPDVKASIESVAKYFFSGKDKKK
jgi:hypothetical protein